MDGPHVNSVKCSRLKNNNNPSSPIRIKTPRPKSDIFNESSLLLSKECRASTPSSKIIPPRPPTESVQRWIHKSRHASIRRFDKQYEQVTKIGSGHFADVYSAKSLDDGQCYAIKKSRFPFQGKADRQRRLQEVRNHELLPPHENCVKYIKSWEEDGLLYIQTELCRTSLNEIIETAEDNKLPEDVVWTYLVDLLLAIKHLHDHDLIHLDIKPENIFISFDNIAKLGDFGLMYDLKKGAMASTTNDHNGTNHTVYHHYIGNNGDAKSDESDSIDEGDSKYLASETMQGKFTKAADIFSLGITIFQIASGMDLPKIHHMLRHNRIDDTYFKGLGKGLIEVIKRMMEAEYTVDDLLKMKMPSPYTKRKIMLKSLRRKKKKPLQPQNRIDDYFTIARTRSKSSQMSRDDIIKHYLSADVDPKYIKSREDPAQIKGQFGVYSTKPIKKGEFVCDYAGDLISKKEADRRIAIYDKKELGSYIFDLKWRDKKYCLDATLPSGRLGRLINHSRNRPNCKVERFDFADRPHLIITAIKDIDENEEILYDYGERDEAIIKANPWLAET